ncbi:hypothetical protein [Paenibacillus sp. CAA11]|nr:hypothetical protein [Paenibacillus sp. CAA11]
MMSSFADTRIGKLIPRTNIRLLGSENELGIFVGIENWIYDHAITL